MARRRRPLSASVASDAGGRTYIEPRPKRKRKTQTPQQRAARAVGRAVTQGARQVSRGAESDVARVLNEAERERRQRARRELAARRAGPTPKRTMIPNPRANDPGQPLMIPAAPAEPEWIRRTLSHKPIRYEDISDFALGKAATNLVFHGDVSHPGAAALEIGAMLPILRPLRALKGLGRAGRAAKAARAVEKAAPEAAAVPKPIRTAPRVATPRLGGAKPPVAHAQAEAAPELAPLPGKAPGVKVREALGPARARQAAQGGLRREELGKRVGAARAASEAAGGGIAGLKASRAQLRGQLPKVQFQHLREGTLSAEDLDALAKQIDAHPGLRHLERDAAKAALLNAWKEGTLPRKFELRHLETVFGEDAAREIVHMSRLRKAGEHAIAVGQIPRSLMTTADISFPMRQGLVPAAAYPKLWKRELRPMIRQMVHEPTYHARMRAIRENPLFEKMRQGRVSFTDIGHDIYTREEAFPTPLAEKIPGVGHVVRGSGRAYTGMANALRARLFEHIYRKYEAKGVNVDDPKFIRDLGKLVNAMTGRGRLGPLETSAPFLNMAFFAPRFVASRINMLAYPFHPGLHPAIRHEAQRAMARLAAGGAAVLGGGAALGASVGVDPRNADFGKLKIGNTRVDVLGGFPQYPRFAAQAATQQRVSSTTGRVKGQTPGRTLGKFVTSKLGPLPSFGLELAQKQTRDFQPLDIHHPRNIGREALSQVTPLTFQDAFQTWQQTHSLPAALGAYGVSATGVGVQTYSNQAALNAVKRRHEDYGQKILEGAVQTGLLKKGAKLTPQLRSALNWREARYEYRAKVGADDTRSRFQADVTFLKDHRIISKAKADRAISWAKHEESAYVVERELRHLSDWYFDDLYGDALADARQKLRDRGYDLPRLR